MKYKQEFAQLFEIMFQETLKVAKENGTNLADYLGVKGDDLSNAKMYFQENYKDGEMLKLKND